VALNGSIWDLVLQFGRPALRPTNLKKPGRYAAFCEDGRLWVADVDLEPRTAFKPIKLWLLGPDQQEVSLPNPGYSDLDVQKRVSKVERVGASPESLFPISRCVAISPDGRQLVMGCDIWIKSGGGATSGGGDAVLELWSLESKQRVAVWDQDGSNSGASGSIVSVCFSRDGRSVAAEGNGVSIWNVNTGKKIAFLRSKDWPVGTVLLTPDGRHVISAGAGGWNLTENRPVQVTINIDEIETGRELASWKHPGSTVKLAISPSGSVVATGADDGMIRLWSRSSGRELARWEAHDTAVSALAFCPDGQLLVSGSADGAAKLWDLPAIREMLSGLGLDW
jgi:WD40 repeat protein